MYRIPCQEAFNAYLLRAEKSYSDFSLACEECKSYGDGTEDYIKDLFHAFISNYNVVVRLEFLIDDFRQKYNETSLKRFDYLQRCKVQSRLIYNRWLDLWRNSDIDKFVDDLPF